MRINITCIILALCLALAPVPLLASDNAMTEEETLAQAYGEDMEVVSNPVVTADPVLTFLNLYSFLQRDLGQGGLVIMDNETMELITSTGTSSTPEGFFDNTFPSNTMFGYIPDVPPEVAALFAAMVPGSTHALEALKPVIAQGKPVFMFIGMRLEQVPEDTVIKPLDVYYVEKAIRQSCNLRGLDDEKAFEALRDSHGFETDDELVLYLIENPEEISAMIDEAAAIMYPRNVNDNSGLVKLGMLFLSVAGALGIIGIAVGLSVLIAHRFCNTEKGCDNGSNKPDNNAGE